MSVDKFLKVELSVNELVVLQSCLSLIGSNLKKVDTKYKGADLFEVNQEFFLLSISREEVNALSSILQKLGSEGPARDILKILR